jgi:hypothetical protein
MVKSLILAFILLFAARLEDAQACMGPHRRTFPTCEISAPRRDERTTIVYVAGGSALSSVTPGSDGIVTEVVDVEIGVADKPHYIVLSSGKPIIWRFTGRIDAVSRVVVLGSQFSGATRTGVVGVPRARIFFVKTDMEKLKKLNPSSCDTFYAACEASAYFDITKAARMHLAGDEPSERYGVDQFVERLRGDVIRVPQDGSVEVGERGGWKQGADGWQSMLGRHEFVGGEGYVETSQNYERGLIKIDAASVVSQETVRDYSVLPAATGMRQLLTDGSLVGSDDARFKAAYDKWNERISLPYRSKLDPNFLFSYKVNYLITRPLTLPAALDRTALLVGEGVEAPNMNGNYYMTCLYYADLRKIQVDPHKSIDWRCTAGSGSLVASESEHAIAMATSALDRMPQASQADKDACREFVVAGDAYFAGIAVSEGAVQRPFGVMPRRIDVVVNRAGKVALYLEMSRGRANWHILPSAQTQITNVVLGEGAAVRGLDPSVPTRTVAPSSPATGSGCNRFEPPGNAYLGGPAALALDQGLQVLAGRGLDSLLRKTNDGRWPSVAIDQDAPRVTFVIE